MTLKVVTDMVSATTHFRDLDVEDTGASLYAAQCSTGILR